MLNSPIVLAIIHLTPAILKNNICKIPRGIALLVGRISDNDETFKNNLSILHADENMKKIFPSKSNKTLYRK